jgi:3-oxosteroid 1-dehydrogenase
VLQSKNGKKASERPSSKIDRRAFVKAAGGTIALSAGAISIGDSEAAAKGSWDYEADVIVVGTGTSGLVAAVTAAAEGAKVILLESAPIVGGASVRSGGGCWLPNNRHMRAAGLQDSRDDALRYMARYSFTQLYDAHALYCGIPEASYHLIEAMYDNASPALDYLEQLGALQTVPDLCYDYWDFAPENKAPYGRMVRVRFEGDHTYDNSFEKAAFHDATAVTPAWYSTINPAGGVFRTPGAEMIRQLKAWIDKNGMPILFEHRAVRLVTNRKREIVGVEATTDEGRKVVTVHARRAVHFGSGGFTQNEDLRLNFQRGPVFGSCGPMTNQGDLVYMATAVGAKLGNMQNAWNIQVVLDHNIESPAIAADMWVLAGDSMIVVNKHGRRIVNEKRPYSDRAEVHYNYDPTNEEWMNLVLFYIFDERVRTLAAGRSSIPPKDTVAPHVIVGQTVDELAKGIADRLKRFAPKLGGFSLAANFITNLKETMVRFNRFAATGVDEDFGRGKYRYDQQWHERSSGDQNWAANDKPNKTMYPLSAMGPYYAVLIAKGQADTNGGPVINPKGQILSVSNEPIPGLYGAGNCIASPSGRAYWGGGGTLGPALTFGYIAGKNAARDPIKQK